MLTLKIDDITDRDELQEITRNVTYMIGNLLTQHDLSKKNGCDEELCTFLVDFAQELRSYAVPLIRQVIDHDIDHIEDTQKRVAQTYKKLEPYIIKYREILEEE